MKKSRVTITDVARASGVSTAAVSLVLSKKPGVSEETRERVLEAARTLGYPLKPLFSAPAHRAINTIGLLISQQVEEEPHLSTFYSYILTAVEATCRQMDLHLMFANLMIDQHHRPIQISPLLERGEVDAFLLAGIYVDEDIHRVLQRRGLPAVLLESYSRVGSYSAVLYDNFNGGYQAAEYLIAKGHRHIGFLGSHASDYPSFLDRRAGYQQALADHSITSTYFADFTVYNAERADVITAALNLVREQPQVTGLVCVNDDAAIDAVSGLKNAGINVPEDISVIGFDDIEMAGSVVPALTTMRVSKQSMGRMAVQMLVNQSEQDEDTVTSLFRPVLVERSSVKDLIQR